MKNSLRFPGALPALLLVLFVLLTSCGEEQSGKFEVISDRALEYFNGAMAAYKTEDCASRTVVFATAARQEENSDPPATYALVLDGTFRRGDARDGAEITARFSSSASSPQELTDELLLPLFVYRRENGERVYRYEGEEETTVSSRDDFVAHIGVPSLSGRTPANFYAARQDGTVRSDLGFSSSDVSSQRALTSFLTAAMLGKSCGGEGRSFSASAKIDEQTGRFLSLEISFVFRPESHPDVVMRITQTETFTYPA